eukprot:scaffold7356_cov164-Chaetoceros_neogracile.AAC.2
MKLHSLLTFSFLAFIQANEVDTEWDYGANILKSTIALVECTVSEVHGLTPPDATEVPVQFACTTDDDDNTLFFDSDAAALLGNDFVSGVTRLALAPQGISPDGMIHVQQAMALGAVTIVSNDVENDRRRKLTTTGIKEVLVVLVVSDACDECAPSQSEAKMSNDVFYDENNLRVRYDDCSNGALIFDPATGTNVNNGVLTVTTTENLDGMTWQNCGRIATNGARGINRDYTMIVCPDVVNFGGAAAWGQMPGSISWYKSRYASAPIVQMHELGHNLGHHHSGKDGVTYADPTCNMGNRGSWSDRGSNFCFNAAKTWANKWYEEYHMTVDPSSGGYDGTLVGINAVKDRTITATGQDIVIKVDSPGETDLYIIYNRQTGANNQVPENGDEVVIVEQSRELKRTSSWRAALSEGEVYTQSSWSGTGTLIVKVCSLETGTPGSARVLVYATGQETLNCNTASPTAVPDTASPTGSPVTKSPTVSPVSASPTGSPVTKSPTVSPVASPTGSPITAPVNVPTGAPVNAPTGAPVKAPVSAPVNAPTGAPVSEPTQDDSCQDSTLKITIGIKKERTCEWIGMSSRRIDAYCQVPAIAANCPVACGICVYLF